MAIDAPTPSASMPASPKPGAMPSPGGAPPAGAPKAPPFGNSGATQPTPNAGAEAAVLQRVSMVVKQVQDMMAQVGATSETGKTLLKALNILVKLAPSGNVSNASERNMLEQAMMKNTQNGAMMQQMKQAQAKPPGGAPAPGGGPPPAMGAAA